MSDPCPLAVILVVVGAVASPLDARTQEAAPSPTAALRDSAVQVMEEARTAWRAQRIREAERDEMLRREADLDTLHVGPLRVLTPRGQTETAARLWTDAWEALSPQLSFMAASFARDTFVFQWAPQLLEIPARSPRVEHVRMRAWYGETVVRRTIRRTLLRRARERLPAEARSWLAGTSIIIDADEAAWERTHRNLATSPSPLAGTCREGVLDACWEILLAVPGGDDPWTEWYGPEERRFFAGTLRGPATGDPDLRRACRNGSDDACLRLLRERGRAPEPLGAEARGALLALALEVGGPGALGRFSERDSASARSRLIAASRLPGDSLVALWRTRALAVRPDPVAPSGPVRAGVLFWVLLLGYLSTRSTRWR